MRRFQPLIYLFLSVFLIVNSGFIPVLAEENIPIQVEIESLLDLKDADLYPPVTSFSYSISPVKISPETSTSEDSEQLLYPGIDQGLVVEGESSLVEKKEGTIYSYQGAVLKTGLIQFPKAGLYRYRLEQNFTNPEDLTHDGILQDGNSWIIDVRTEEKEGQIIPVEVLSAQDGEHDPLSSVVFHNEADSSVTVPAFCITKKAVLNPADKEKEFILTIQVKGAPGDHFLASDDGGKNWNDMTASENGTNEATFMILEGESVMVKGLSPTDTWRIKSLSYSDAYKIEDYREEKIESITSSENPTKESSLRVFSTISENGEAILETAGELWKKES